MNQQQHEESDDLATADQPVPASVALNDPTAVESLIEGGEPRTHHRRRSTILSQHKPKTLHCMLCNDNKMITFAPAL